MLFDLRSAGRRRTVKGVYLGLALLMFVGFVGFSVGSSGLSGGIVDAITGSNGGGGTDNSSQERLVAIRLAEADQTGVGVELDDRAQRIRLVDTDGVEQWRIDERDRGDAGTGDANRTRRHGYPALVSASARTARPAVIMAASSIRSAAVGITSGARTGPAAVPSMVTPALTSETA